MSFFLLLSRLLPGRGHPNMDDSSTQLVGPTMLIKKAFVDVRGAKYETDENKDIKKER